MMSEELKLPELPEPGIKSAHALSNAFAFGYHADQMREYARQAVLAERERAARAVEAIAQAWWKRGHVPPPSDIAAAIRAGAIEDDR